MKREDDFEARRQHLKDLSETELEKRFWDLCQKIVCPLISLAENHTSPAVERSVLLRMGFSSLEAKGIVERVMNLGLLGKGAGNVVYRASKSCGMGIKEAGAALVDGTCDDGFLLGLFEEGK